MLSKNLNLFLSSSFPLRFFFRETLSLDLLDRFFFLNLNSLSLVKNFLVIFSAYFPFSNSLLKFKNRVYLIIYFLIFEILTGVRPRVTPVFKKNSISSNSSITSKRSKRLQILNSSIRSVDSFSFCADLKDVNFFNFLLILYIFASKHTYSNLTVPSKLIKVDFNGEFLFGSLKFSSGVSLFEFLSGVDEILNSKVKLNVHFSLKKESLSFDFINKKSVLPFIFQSLNFNSFDRSLPSAPFLANLYSLKKLV